jgi:predicted nucleic acid-binding Zn ribbon protein
MMHKKNYQDIKSVLHTLVKRYNLEGEIIYHSVFNNWDMVVGKDLAKKCEPVKISDRTLFLKTQNVLWKDELNKRKNKILNLISKRLNSNYLKKINFI